MLEFKKFTPSDSGIREVLKSDATKRELRKMFAASGILAVIKDEMGAQGIDVVEAQKQGKTRVLVGVASENTRLSWAMKNSAAIKRVIASKTK